MGNLMQPRPGDWTPPGYPGNQQPVGSQQPVQRQFGGMDPSMWITLGSNMLAANAAPGNISGMGRLGMGISNAMPQISQMKQAKARREEQVQQLQIARDMRKEVSSLAQSGLKTLDLNGDGTVTPQERQRGMYLRLAAQSGDPKWIGKANEVLTGNQIGQYNPRDYTTDSFSNFTESGNPRSLERYEPTQVKEIGGVPYLFDPASQKWQPVRVGGQTVTPDVVATNQSTIDTKLKGAEARTAFKLSFPGLMTSAQSGKRSLESLLSNVRRIGTGPGAEAVMTKLSATYQATEAQLKQAALLNIAALAKKGVRLNPITEEELKILFATSASLNSYPAANIAIIERRIADWEEVIADLKHQMSYYDTGADPLEYRGRERTSTDGWSIERQ